MGAKVASGGGGKRGGLEVNAEPNVIPFIDIMLVLMIIFMVAAPIATVDISVALPQSKLPPSERPPSPTWVSLKNDAASGQVLVYVMNDKVSFGTVGEEAYRATNKNNPLLGGDPRELLQQRVYVRADGDIEYRNVMLVMNRLQDQGFYKIGLVAEDRRR